MSPVPVCISLCDGLSLLFPNLNVNTFDALPSYEMFFQKVKQIWTTFYTWIKFLIHFFTPFFPRPCKKKPGPSIKDGDNERAIKPRRYWAEFYCTCHIEAHIRHVPDRPWLLVDKIKETFIVAVCSGTGRPVLELGLAATRFYEVPLWNDFCTAYKVFI